MRAKAEAVPIGLVWAAFRNPRRDLHKDKQTHCLCLPFMVAQSLTQKAKTKSR